MKVKTLFNGWRDVTEEQAKKWATHIFKYSTTLGSDKERYEYINRRLKGTTAEMLLKGVRR